MRTVKWATIADDFTDLLILGNGSSIAVDSRFKYASLKEEALKNRSLKEEDNKVFKHLKVEDWEHVMLMLWHAAKIAKALKTPYAPIKDAQRRIRLALIHTLRVIHPKHGEVSDKLERIGSFLSKFNLVSSLNYDLICYWALMEFNKKVENTHQIVDGFGSPDDDWLYKNTNSVTKNQTMICYPHGNLVLAFNKAEKEAKIRKGANLLLDEIAERWRNSSAIPLFISEGFSEKKYNIIRNSPYLSWALEETISKPRESLVFYGWSFSEQDNHVLAQLAHCKAERCAVSFHKPDLEKESLAEKEIRLRKYLGEEIEICFFSADDAGAWIY